MPPSGCAPKISRERGQLSFQIPGGRNESRGKCPAIHGESNAAGIETRKFMHAKSSRSCYIRIWDLMLLHDCEQIYLENSRWKKVDVLIFLRAVLVFSNTIRHRILKKKLLNVIANVVGFNFFIIVVISKRCFEAQFAFSETRSFQEVLLATDDKKPLTAKTPLKLWSQVKCVNITQTFW